MILSFSSQFIPPELERDVGIQRVLENLTESNIDEAEKYIFESEPDDFYFILQILVRMTTTVHRRTELYVYLLLKIIVYLNIKTHPFPIARSSVPFVQKLYVHGVFSQNEIRGLINTAKTISNFPYKQFIDINFMDIFNDIVIPYETDYYKYGYTKGSLMYIIRYDLIDEFSDYVKKHPDYTKQLLTLNVYHCGTIAAAAFYCAEKIFDACVIAGNLVDNSVGRCAVLGGNMHIIKTCRSCGCSLSDCVTYALNCHHREVFQWLIKKTSSIPDLAVCARSCNVEGLLYYLHMNKVKINEQDRRSRTILHFAARHLPLKLTKYLVEKCSADPLLACNRTLIGLHYAARYGRFDIVKYYVEDLKVKVDSGLLRTPLICSISTGDHEIIKYLIEKDEKMLHKPSFRYGIFPIDTASMMNDIGTMKMIKENGGEINGATFGLLGTGQNSLVYAINGNAYDACKYLMENGADPHALTSKGKNLYYYAAKKKNIKMLRLLKSKNIEMTGIEMIAGACSTTIMMWLLRNGSKFTDNFSKNAYHTAAQSGTVRELDFIFRNSNIDINNKDSNGRTPLHNAAALPYFAPKFLENTNLEKDKKNSIEKVKFLLNHGARIDDVDEFGANVIWRAVYANNSELCEFLIEEWVKRGFTQEQLVKMRNSADLSLYEYMKGYSLDFDCVKKLFAKNEVIERPKVSAYFEI